MKERNQEIQKLEEQRKEAEKKKLNAVKESKYVEAEMHRKDEKKLKEEIEGLQRKK